MANERQRVVITLDSKTTADIAEQPMLHAAAGVNHLNGCPRCGGTLSRWDATRSWCTHCGWYTRP